MTRKESIALQLPAGDAEYVLEVVARTLRSHGVTKAEAVKPLTRSAKRLLSISLSDRGLKVSRKTLATEARRIARRLLA